MVNRTRSVPMIFNAVRFGNDCLARRIEVGLSGEELEKLLTFDKTTLYKYERGAEPNPKIGNFLALCNVYDLDPREYFELER